MTHDEKVSKAVDYWMAMSDEAIKSARLELDAGSLSFAVNRCYYAAFYAASAVLLTRGHHFVKHAGVRAALHQHLVKPGLLSKELADLYDKLLDKRQEGDYTEFVEFAPEEVRKALDDAVALVAALRAFLPQKGK